MQNLNTLLVHGGVDGDATTGAVTVPIYQTATYRQPGLGQTPHFEYSRTGNPTREALEKQIAALEGGKHGLAFASGMAAITAVLGLFGPGDEILINSNVYGGSYRVLDAYFKNYGLAYRIADTSPQGLQSAFSPATKAILLESPANPLLTVSDIRAISEIAHRHGVLVIVDNTFMSPYLQRPLSLGADIVLHSATKYIGGHSDVVAGLVALSDDSLAQKLYFIQNATGGVAGPFDSYLLLRGLKTLGVRLDRHNKNATAVARLLDGHTAVAQVYYPGLESDPGYHIHKKQADGPGGMVSFTLKQGYTPARFYQALEVFALAESLGGVESLACHPATMTHAAIPEAVRQEIGISDNLIRLSVGIEDADDLLRDLEQALYAAGVE